MISMLSYPLYFNILVVILSSAVVLFFFVFLMAYIMSSLFKCTICMLKASIPVIMLKSILSCGAGLFRISWKCLTHIFTFLLVLLIFFYM